MTPRTLIFSMALLAATPVFAQGPHGHQRAPGGAAHGGAPSGPSQAVPRSQPAPPPPSANGPAAAPAPSNPNSVRAVPRGSVPPSYRYRYVPRYRYGYDPYLYGGLGLGLGYYYYDPLWGPYYDPYYGAYGAPAAPVYDSGYAYTGELRLQVKPREADVYVDGYYAGRVDDFDGIFQSLSIQEGPHTIRIVAPGYQPLEFQVRIYPGHKTSYKGELIPQQP